MNPKAKIYVTVIVLIGFGLIAVSLYRWDLQDLPRFYCYVVLAVMAASLKVKLPGIQGTMSVGFLFVLAGVSELGLAETMIIGCAGTLVQCSWRPKRRPKLIEVAFSIANTGVATVLAYRFYHTPAIHQFDHISPLLLIVTGLVYFGLNTAPIAGVIALSEGKRFGETWRSNYLWSFPFYLVGASVAWIIGVVAKQLSWQSLAMLLPVSYLIFRSYRLYLGRLDDQRLHAESMAGLHLRTIEALAQAIEAKDHTTHEHLERVRTYAIEIGKRMSLAPQELNALRAAALLHDIGKLAVPEHIISKPGRLTPEEFEKMKIHPVVGAEILECVSFPYPVAPIVRSHHEKWDGSGYPDGLKAEAIPIGARILAAVDCLDALASDRQYRKALPLDDAMLEVEKLAGRSFDPAVVRVLKRHYVELEHMALTQPHNTTKLSTNLRIEQGEAPDAGFETSPALAAPDNGYDFLSTIAAARQEAQLLCELIEDLGDSMSPGEILSVVAARLKKIVRYDALAIYARVGGKLIPRYVTREDFGALSSLEITVGEGLSGWVAENHKPIVNGNPAVESGSLASPSQFGGLRSALAVPLEGPHGCIGVIALYRADGDAFFRDHLRILLAIAGKVAAAIESALVGRPVERPSTNDSVSELPNARSLFLHLDAELARAKRTGEPLSVMVCDLDGFKQTSEMLPRAADALRTGCREQDYMARMGGGEFVLLLPGCGRDSVEGRIRNLRQAAINADLPISLGEACYPDDGAEPEELLAAADKRMYADKRLSKGKQPGKECKVVAFPQVTSEALRTAI
jgi:diguanylate cyclase (GGDEF)-like protein/putative nucleotidyltransferase with HDIG domain